MRTRKIISCFWCLFFFAHIATQAQQNSIEKNTVLLKKEDSLKRYSTNILQAPFLDQRFSADSIFTKIFVRALKIKGSFYYPFDSLITVSKLYPPDSSFRIFTWHVMMNEDNYIHHGAIQFKTNDGSLKLLPLFDKANFIQNLEDTITSNKHWVGAIYYNLVENEFENKKYYTLFGYDEFGISSNRKIIDIMHFENSIPIFGGDFFDFPDSPQLKIARYVMEYKKNAGPKLNFDKELNLIVKEKLVSETNEMEKKSTLIGEGEYEGFYWREGKWHFTTKVLEAATEDHVPMPAPIKE